MAPVAVSSHRRDDDVSPTHRLVIEGRAGFSRQPAPRQGRCRGATVAEVASFLGGDPSRRASVTTPLREPALLTKALARDTRFMIASTWAKQHPHQARPSETCRPDPVRSRRISSVSDTRRPARQRLFDSTDLKLTKIVPILKRSCKPPRLLSSARPCFRRRQRIEIFGQNLRIGAARSSIVTRGQTSCHFAVVQPGQAPLQLLFFHNHSGGEQLCDLLVQGPKLFQRHLLQIHFMHDVP